MAVSAALRRTGEGNFLEALLMRLQRRFPIFVQKGDILPGSYFQSGTEDGRCLVRWRAVWPPYKTWEATFDAVQLLQMKEEIPSLVGSLGGINELYFGGHAILTFRGSFDRMSVDLRTDEGLVFVKGEIEGRRLELFLPIPDELQDI